MREFQRLQAIISGEIKSWLVGEKEIERAVRAEPANQRAPNLFEIARGFQQTRLVAFVEGENQTCDGIRHIFTDKQQRKAQGLSDKVTPELQCIRALNASIN